MPVMELTQDNFETVINQKEIIIMDFWAEWCGPCKSFSPIFTEVAEKNPDIIFAKINIDKETELATAFAVRSIPQIVIMKQDTVLYSESGTMPASSLQNLIDQAKKVDVSKLKEENE